METVALLYEDYQKELAEDFKNTFLKRASDTDSSRSNDTVIDEVTDMLSTNIAVYTEKLLQRWGFSSGGEGGGGGDVTVTLDDLLKKYLSDNYVTIKGDQEVFGEKDFRKGIRIAGRRLYWDEGNDALVIEGAAYTTRWLSAKGVSPGGGGGLISLVYGFESLGGTFDNNDNTATFNAFTINEIWKLASSGLTNVTVTGSGNAVTDVTKGSDGRSLTFTKGNMFASKSEFDALNTKFNDFLTGSDADDIINKWSELEVFLQGMKESDNLAVILQSKMDKSAFNKLFSALDSDGNEIDPSDDTKTVAAIRANFGFWGVDYVSAKGVSKGSGGTGGASALYQLVDVLANDTGDGVDGAVAGKALVFDGTHWKAADAGLNESQLSAFLSLNGYLTQTAADGRYVTSARKVIAGTGLSGGGSLTSDVTLSLGTSGVVAGTYTKVMVDVYGRVTSGTSLSATDIPSLDWSKITTGKPTTLAGYGITDAYSKTEADGKYVTIATAQTISGAKTFSAVTKTASVLPSADANSELGGTANRWNNIYSVNGTFSQNVTAKLLSASETLQIGDAYLKWDSTNNAVYVIKKDGTTPVGFYSTDWLSAKGVSMSGVQTGTLADLTDVEITNPTNGQALKYDAISQKWVNGTIDSFNVNQMWTELTKADSSKVIDASHIPTSVLDNRWVKKAGDTMTGTLTSASTTGSIIFKGLENCDITNIYTNNGTLYSDTSLAIRNGLRFNWYDTYWYIGNLRGAGTNSSGFGIANESNKLCLQVTPDYTTAPVFRSSASQGTAPLIVYSTTQVSNLNADLLDGYHQTSFLQTNGSNQYVSLTGGDGNNEGYRLVLDATVSGGWSISSMTLLVTSRHSGTGVISIVFHTTNQDSTAFVGSLNYYGSLISFGSTMWRLFYNTSTKKLRLFWHFYNHNDCRVSILNRRGVMQDIANAGWYTTIPDGMGTEIPSYYNRSDTTGSLATSRTLWGQPFNGTANVSGDMTGVGSITMSGDLKIGNATSPNTIYFYGTTGDGPGSYSHTFIAERIWGGTECSELVLFKGNDIGNGTDAITVSNSGPDRIRHIAAAHLFQTYTTGLSGSVESVCTSSALKNLFSIASNRVISYVQLQSTIASGVAPFIVASNTVVSNLNADLLDGQHLSDLDGRYVNVTGDTMTGDLNISGGHRLYLTQASATSTQYIMFQGGDNDYGRIAFGGTGNNAGWMEIASCDDGNEPIYVRQYTGVFTSIKRTATLLDASGNTSFPGSVTSVRHISTVGTGTQPYQCNSTTLNTNLNADLLDGYHISQISLGYPSGHIKHRVGPFGGGQDKNWRKIVTYVNTTGGQYKACTIIGTIWINHGNHSQGQVTEIPFQVVLYAYGGTANSQVNGNYLYIPPYCTFDCIRIVRYASNSWELQIRQYSDWTTINCEYSAFSTGGGTINAGQFSTDIHTSTVTNAYNSNVTTPQSHSVWGVTRTFYIQDYHSVNTGAGVSVNGGSNCYLKLPSTTRFSRIDFSTPNANIRHSGNDNGNEVGSSTLSNLVIDSWYGVSFTTTCSSTYQNKIAMSVNCRTGRVTANNFHAATNITANGAITAKASSSDIRLKTDIQGYDAMGIIRKFRSVKYHWNAIAKENSEVFNHDNWNYGLIAQDLLSGGYSQWVKDTFNDYYTIDYERLIPVVWKGLQEVDDEVTRLRKEVVRLNKRISELEKFLCA